MDLHALLKRQLKRLGLDAQPEGWPPTWGPLLERVSRAYEDHDQERYLLERSQDLASREMTALNQQLRQERDLLDERVRDRTEALRLSEARLQSLLSLSADWIWELDPRLRFRYVSDGIESATGLPAGVLLGQSALVEGLLKADPADRQVYRACMHERKPFRDFRFSLLMDSGVRRHIRLSGEPVHDAQGRFIGYRGVGRDVTEATLAQQRVHELATVDMLTGLPNRHRFMSELDRALARAQHEGGHFAVVFIDLDRFKAINDTLGHGAGDELLLTMGRRLRHALRTQDMVARFGGDEFVVLLEGPCDTAALTAVGHKMLAAIGEPLALQECSLLVTGSVGISRFPHDAQDAATLLKHADAAMYLAKDRGKNNVQFYSAELAQRSAHDFALEGELRAALRNDELMLHYQPKFDLASGRLVGSEALLRWRHPVRGLVPPGDFIGLAEERGLIVPLGRWVAQEACRQIQRWRSQGLGVLPVAINLSARQFSSDSLLADLQEALAAHGVRHGELEVELTESVLMSEPERADALLRQIARLGVSVAIDDFGTGYSSLSYLKRLPATTVKIDRSFVRGLPGERDDVVITQAVIALAHSLQMRVVAEGVETDGQLALLRQMGCDEAQGFLLGRPTAAEALQLLLEPALEAPMPAAALS